MFINYFQISGVGIIAAGAVVLADVGEYDHFMEGRILAPPIVLIVAGAIVFLVAFLGCFGAIRESHPMLIAFAVSLLVIFILELAVGISAAVFKSDFQVIMKDTLRTSLNNYSRYEKDRMAWATMQSKLNCCGVDGPYDWLGPNSQDKAMPVSCCHPTREGAEPPNEAQCRTAQATDIYVWQDGCYYKLKEIVNTGAKVLIGVGIGIAFIELVGIVLACWLASVIKNEQGESK